MKKVCHIEILKDGVYFVVRVHLANGSIREYRHHVFEDVLTEMVIDLQDDVFLVPIHSFLSSLLKSIGFIYAPGKINENC